jgi:hypothetical protein
MTRMLPLAALALACVAFASGLLVLLLPPPWQARIYGVAEAFGCFAAVGLLLATVWVCITAHRMRFRDRCAAIAAAALVVALSPWSAFAAEVATVGDKAVILPWGDWLVALAVSLREPILTILIPIIAGYAIQAIRKVYPWAALFLSQRRVEMMLEAAVGYGLNAVNGAAKGKTLSVNVAVPVIAKGTQYVIDTAPPAVIKAAGGADGIAARIFRKLDLDDDASEAAVLIPAQVQIGAGTVTADELRQMDEMVRR